jgi:sugar (pentulose or hexulose) kinase
MFFRAFFLLIDQIPQHMRPHVKRLAIDATSPTVVLLDRASGKVLEPAKLYHAAQPAAAIEAAKVRALKCFRDLVPPSTIYVFHTLPSLLAVSDVTDVSRTVVVVRSLIGSKNEFKWSAVW